MNGSAEHRTLPTTSLTVTAALAAALLISPATPASAQESPPDGVQIAPLGSPSPLAPPLSLFSTVPRDTQSDPGTMFNEAPEGAIAVRQLEEVSSDSLGVMDGFTGGLPVTMWEGTSKELVDLLLPKLPSQMPSFAMRDLAQRLLLSVARPPRSAPQEDIFVDMTAIVPSAIGFSPEGETVVDAELGEQSTTVDLGILDRRAMQLAAMGDWAGVRALVELAPQSSLTESLNILRTDLDLVEGNDEGACLEVQNQLGQSTDPYWQKVFAFCQLRDGNTAGAFLTMDLLRETGVEDAAFFWVAELMSGNRPITPNGLDRLSPLQLAMLRSAGRPFPDPLVRLGDPTLLRMLAESEPLFVTSDDDTEDMVAERRRRALDLRLEAAERAVALGSLDPEVLRNLYRAEGATDEQEEDAGAIQGEPDPAGGSQPQAGDEEEPVDLSNVPAATPLERAELFRLAEAQVIPIARAEVISRAIDFARNDRGRNGPNVPTMGAIFAPLIETLEPTGDLTWFAGNAARALIGAGRLESGRAWLALSEAYARTSIEAADVAAAMWPVERQLQPTMTNRFTPLRLQRWEDSRSPGRLAGDKTLVLSTMTALGEDIAPADWFSIMDRRSRASGELPAPHIWHGLTLAANGGRVGEAALLAVLALDEDGPAGVSPVVLSHVISSLVAVGLEQDARRLAVEAALVQGL
jgi:hypothetical protein